MGWRPFLYYTIAIALLATGWKAPDASAADQLETLPNIRAARQPFEARETVTTKTLGGEERGGAALPQKGLLVAMIRWGATTFGVVDVSNGQWIQLRTKPTGPLFFSQRAGRLAYLVREGVDPANNYIEILDRRLGNTLVVKPAADHAILGFALAPDGKKLAYAAMNIQRSRSTDVNWHVGVADLERHETHVTLTSSSKKIPEEGIPVPFEWSHQTGRIYLQGWLPFRGMIKQSIWAASPDGKQLIKVIPETSYVGIPSLSPDGSRFSYLANDPDSLPRNYLPPPGPPPGNMLSVINLVSGEKTPWARAAQRAFGAHAWSANGEEVLAVEQDWLEGRFRDDEIRRIGKVSSMSIAKIDQSRSLKRITGLLACPDHELFWVERERSSSRLYSRSSKSAQASGVLYDIADGTIQLLGCFNR
jgi:hypothetical protein